MKEAAAAVAVNEAAVAVAVAPVAPVGTVARAVDRAAGVEPVAVLASSCTW